jgi:hypothetical protein
MTMGFEGAWAIGDAIEGVSALAGASTAAAITTIPSIGAPKPEDCDLCG